MLTKEEWITKFENENGRKPIPKEFIAAKNNGEFGEENFSTVTNDYSETEPVLESVLDETKDEVFSKDDESDRIENSGEDELPKKKFCFNCGTANPFYQIVCSQCGSDFGGTTGSKSFFSELSSKIKDISAIATQKTKELTQNAQTHTQLSKEKRNRDVLYKTLGQSYFERYKDNGVGEFEELLLQIKECNEKIRLYEMSTEETNQSLCFSCGKSIDPNAAFCSHCGTSTKQQKSEKTNESEQKCCKNCGETLSGSGAFCSSCGNKI